MNLRLLLVCLVLPFTALAQGPTSWWYFGNTAGIHFTPGGPVAVNDGQLNTSEGCASISDTEGNLLFYTDGITVYDKNHNAMPNGTGLLGDPSSTHSGIIVPRPGNPNEYYIFTVDANGASGVGMHYSKVDMDLNNGNGDVVGFEKNIALIGGTSEKLSALKKPAGYWVITHIDETADFYAYEVTAAGVNTVPVISTTEWVTSDYAYGIASSSDGSQIAAVFREVDSIHLYQFDINTGLVSSNLKIGSSMSFVNMYGLQFSPSGNLLYMQAHSTGDVRQFDLSSGVSSTISASEQVIGTPAGDGGGQLQLGANGVLYCSRNNQAFLSAIYQPNVVGLGCDWVDTAIVLTGISRYGLPTFAQSFFSHAYAPKGHCLGDVYSFNMDTTGVETVLWNFGDPGSGNADTSTAYFPNHVFSDTGNYMVTLIVWGDTFTDTIISSFYVYPRQVLDLGNDTTLCFGDTLRLDINQAYSTYLWHNKSREGSFEIWSDSVVSVTLNGACDTLSDTLSISLHYPVSLNLGNDTTFCEGNSLTLDAGVEVEAEYGWNTGNTGQVITITRSGKYLFTAQNSCGIYADSIKVEVLPIPDSTLLPPDTLNCFDNAIVLTRPENDSITYIWSDSTSKLSFTVDTTMSLWLAAFNECGTTRDTINIVFNGEIKTELGEDTTVCDEDSIRLFGTDPEASYVWNTGDTTDSIWSIPGITENYILTISLRECALVESRRVFSDREFCPKIDCDMYYGNVFTPNGDGMNDKFRVGSDCDLYAFDMTIFNRWGQLVHYSTNIAHGWDGTVNGVEASTGTYYFVVKYKDYVVVDSDRFFTRGSFTLLR